MILHCTHCGEAISPGSSFCSSCGNKIEIKPAVRICTHYGTPLKERSKFCPSCGKSAEPGPVPQPRPVSPIPQLPQAKSVPPQPQQPPTKPVSPVPQPPQEKPVVNIQSFVHSADAAEIPGKMSINLSGNTDGGVKEVSGIRNPFGVLWDGVKSTVQGVTGLFKGKNLKNIIIAGVLGIVWAVLLILSRNGINGAFWKALQILTFARGGLDSAITGKIGGIFGKCFYASAVIVLTSNIRSIGGGFKKLFSKQNFQSSQLSGLLSGAGGGLCADSLQHQFRYGWPGGSHLYERQ